MSKIGYPPFKSCFTIALYYDIYCIQVADLPQLQFFNMMVNINFSKTSTFMLLVSYLYLLYSVKSVNSLIFTYMKKFYLLFGTFVITVATIVVVAAMQVGSAVL